MPGLWASCWTFQNDSAQKLLYNKLFANVVAEEKQLKELPKGVICLN